jgi:hypothetical protein
VSGCGGPLVRWPKTEAAWPARAGRRGAPPCRGHRARGCDGGATSVCSPVALMRREHRRGEAHPSGNKGGGSPMGSVDGEAEGYNGAAEGGSR